MKLLTRQFQTDVKKLRCAPHFVAAELQRYKDKANESGEAKQNNHISSAFIWL